MGVGASHGTYTVARRAPVVLSSAATMDPAAPPSAPWLPFVRAPLAPPVGMRDLLGPRVARRRAQAAAAMETFARYGYAHAVTPAFEREDVLLRGISGADAADLVRLLDPDTGEVLALRSDMTPQVARIVATHFRGAPMPVRVAYEGTVLHRPRGRARRHRQLAQAGVECVGWSGPDADLEVLRVTLEALRRIGIRDVVVELSHAAPLRRALALAPSDRVDEVADALARKDRVAWSHSLADAPAVAAWLDRVAALAGDAEAVAARAGDALEGLLDASERAEVTALGAVAAELRAEGLAARTLVDLGELRGRAYYTGAFFQVFVDGVGGPIAAGGRYDQLLARYGVDLPATGAAIFLDAVEDAAPSDPAAGPERVVVAGPSAARRPVADGLRREGAQVIEREGGDAEALAAFVAATGASRLLRVG